jgi:hypothetical protein
MWEEWRYPPECPDLGDYIQVDTECQFYMHRVSLEGIVTKVSRLFVYLTPEAPTEHHLVTLRWRRRKLPEFSASRHTREEVDA